MFEKILKQLKLMKTSQIFNFPKSANEAKIPMCLSVHSCQFVASVNLERE